MGAAAAALVRLGTASMERAHASPAEPATVATVRDVVCRMSPAFGPLSQ